MNLSKKLMIGAVVALFGFAELAAEQNAKEYFDAHLKEANRGIVHAQFNVGWCYSTGKGVKMNQNQALSWFRRAANGGSEEAMYIIGLDFEKKRNIKQAIVWYRKAKSHEGALYKLAGFYEKGQGVKQSWTEAAKLYKQAAGNGMVLAEFKYGVCCAMGQGVKQSWAEAAKWYLRAANHGHSEAQYNLGWCYEKGMGVKQSWAEALKWYKKSADLCFHDAIMKLAECYAEGKGIAANKELALFWYREGASHGIASAKEKVRQMEAAQNQ